MERPAGGGGEAPVVLRAGPDKSGPPLALGERKDTGTAPLSQPGRPRYDATRRRGGKILSFRIMVKIQLNKIQEPDDRL